MTDEKIKKLNELARKEKSEGLTAEEKKEQIRLRSEYIEAYRASLRSQLDNMYIVDKYGNKRKLQKKKK